MSDSTKKELVTSKKLLEIQDKITEDTISLKQLIDIMSGEGIQLLVIILLAPFLIPVSIPGSSTPFGILIILLEISFLMNKSLYLPNFVGKTEISKENVFKLFNILERILHYLEKISKPRGKFFDNKYALKINALITIILSLLLFLPLPIPFTDFIPSVTMLLLAISTLERDSLMMVLGYIMTIVTISYFSSVGYLGVQVIIIALEHFGIYI